MRVSGWRLAPLAVVILGLALTLGGCDRDSANNAGSMERTEKTQASPLKPWRGQWVVLNYWAIWCKPCREEVPELNAFQQAHPETVKVLGVNFDGVSSAQRDQQINELGIEFQVLHRDPLPALGLKRPQGLPTTYVFNPAGEHIHTLQGPQTMDSLKQATSQKE